MKIHPKQFYYPMGVIGAVSVIIFLTLKIGYDPIFILVGLSLYVVISLISFTVPSSRRLRINLPFVTDLIDTPTTPTYRIEENRFGGYRVIKSKVGFVHFNDEIIIVFPPLLLLRYKSMVDFEDTFVIEGTLHEIKDANLKEYWESEYFNKYQEFIEDQEIMENGKNLLEKINQQYLNNFK